MSYSLARTNRLRQTGLLCLSWKLSAMFDNIDKKELTRLFLIGVIFIVIVYLFGRWLVTI